MSRKTARSDPQRHFESPRCWGHPHGYSSFTTIQKIATIHVSSGSSGDSGLFSYGRG